MQLFNSFKKTGKRYAVEKQGSLASTFQAEQPATENTAVEVGYRNCYRMNVTPLLLILIVCICWNSGETACVEPELAIHPALSVRRWTRKA